MPSIMPIPCISNDFIFRDFVDEDGNKLTRIMYNKETKSEIQYYDDFESYTKNPNKGFKAFIKKYPKAKEIYLNKNKIIKIIDLPLDDIIKLDNFYGFVGDNIHYAILAN